MSQRGKKSEAHEYDERGQCIWCSMFRVNVEQLSHDCTPAREAIFDAAYLKRLAEVTDGK